MGSWTVRPAWGDVLRRGEPRQLLFVLVLVAALGLAEGADGTPLAFLLAVAALVVLASGVVHVLSSSLTVWDDRLEHRSWGRTTRVHREGHGGGFVVLQGGGRRWERLVSVGDVSSGQWVRLSDRTLWRTEDLLRLEAQWQLPRPATIVRDVDLVRQGAAEVLPWGRRRGARQRARLGELPWRLLAWRHRHDDTP
ncbi:MULTISPECIES: hypothetical protein [unclassified Aeromicrobium]|uniref:hypothetical protein n=1 Tax=unclassified Aeromicrobium TaxID=2633570 RepID=UPI00288B10B9|nr:MULTISPECIES: hypothetical protein [unclassified Aeromicrobium]